jgi:hypothetical protein
MNSRELWAMRACMALFILITVLDLVNPGFRMAICNSFGNTSEYGDIQK